MVKVSKVKKSDMMAILNYVIVEQVEQGGKDLVVKDLDGDALFVVRGAPLVEKCLSADQYDKVVKLPMTKLAEKILECHNRPASVCFIKKDGSVRPLRGRLVSSAESLLGRSKWEDLDLPLETNGNPTHRMRQVDHRTLQWLIVDGVKYELKK